MGHHSCCNKQKVRRGLWSPEEDEKLIKFMSSRSHCCWSTVPKLAGLQRCGKSCRLRWINYLRPDLKRGSFSPQEEALIIELHRLFGNRWAHIAKQLPGRTDNEVKNFWNSAIKKKILSQAVLLNNFSLSTASSATAATLSNTLIASSSFRDSSSTSSPMNIANMFSNHHFLCAPEPVRNTPFTTPPTTLSDQSQASTDHYSYPSSPYSPLYMNQIGHQVLSSATVPFQYITTSDHHPAPKCNADDAMKLEMLSVLQEYSLPTSVSQLCSLQTTSLTPSLIFSSSVPQQEPFNSNINVTTGNPVTDFIDVLIGSTSSST